MRGSTVLLVEDDDAHAELVERALVEARAGTIVARSRDGQEALELLSGSGDRRPAVKPDVILLDLRLPRVDGLALLERLASDEATRLVPTVVMSTSDASADVERAYRAGASAYVVKPMDYEEFLGTVEAFAAFWLDRNRLPAR